jgi:suppressor for copper-sensitivity B
VQALSYDCLGGSRSLNPAFCPLSKSIDRTNDGLLKYPSSETRHKPARNGLTLKLRCSKHLRVSNLTLLVVMLCLLIGSTARGQGLQPLSGFGLGGSSDAGGQKLKASGYFTAPANGKPAMLYVTAELSPGWHTYSLTQAPGGPLKTKVKLNPSADYKLAGDFQPNPPPTVHHYDDIWPNLAVEEHEGRVTWSAPIEIAPGANLNSLQISGAFNSQVCAKDCLPPTDYKFVAHLEAGNAQSAAVSKMVAADNSSSPPAVTYKPNMVHLAFGGEIKPAVVPPGNVAHLVISVEPASGWHVYGLAATDPKDVSKPTLIVLTRTSGLRYTAARPSRPPQEKQSTVNQAGKELFYDQPVTWTVDLEVPRDARPGQYAIEGLVGFQTCNDSSCDMPSAAKFSGVLNVGDAAAKSTPLTFQEAKYSEAAKQAEQNAGQPSGAPVKSTSEGSAIPPANNSGGGPLQVHIIGESADAAKSLATVLISAFIGGLILNLMPCVLPVIGLKILSFVEQSHHHRSRVLMLNIWYSLGLMSVFLVLATLACGASLGLRSENLSWGEQFSSTTFNIVMSCVVFVMALSFLGIWEIPIPGFVGSGKTAEVATHEGAAGAFAKGALSTVLATPCSGPLLGSVFGFMLQQTPGVIYAIFACIGFGMASPYLLIGVFPQLIRFLPKPGAWMDTFKHIMGFVLLGTVVFLFTFLARDYVVPTFGLLVGLWAACWWIGRVPLTAELGRKMAAWIQGAVVAAGVGCISFVLLLPHDALLPWQPFSTDALAKLRSEGKTVMVDFTADWCLTCKTNLKFAINTPGVLDVIKSNNVVPLLADWTDGSQEIKDMLSTLESNSIPVVAIFPADKPNEAFVLRDLISQSRLLDALKQAGPSQSAVAVKQTVMQ